MEKSRKNIILVIILLSVFCIPLFFDNRLINVNTIHRFLFSAITLILCVFLCTFGIKYSVFPQLKIIFASAALFLLFLLISAEVNDRLILAFEDFTLYLNVFIFAYLVFLLFQVYESEKLLFYISSSIAMICLIVSVLGILEFFNINLLNFQPNSRPGSTLSIRNFASEYAIIALPFSFLPGLIKNNKIIKIISASSALIILVFIFFCRTRSSYVVLFIYFIILTIFFFYRKIIFGQNFFKYYSIIVLLIIISFFIGLYSAPNIDKERKNLNNTVASIFDKNYPENTARINYWKTAAKIFLDEPITGIGTGSWFGIYPYYNGNIYNDENILNTSEINPHNDYLEVLSENGIFGFIFFILLLLTFWIKLLREAKEKTPVLPVLLSYSGFLVVSFFSFPKDNVALVILLSTLIGISLSLYVPKIKSEEKTINLKVIITILPVSISLILILIVIFNYIRYDSELTYLSALKDKASGNYKSMLEKFDNIEIAFFPLDANRMPVEYYKGVGHFELKNYKEAINSFNLARELAPYSPAIKSNIASSFYMLKDSENAIKLLMDMKMDYPFFVEPQINLLAIYANTGQDSLAQSLLDEITKKYIEHEFIKNYFVLEKIKVYYNEKNSH